jgi:primosomal protein N' (replication factor Y)
VESDLRNAERRDALTGPTTARVVPDLAAFAVDDGFAYAVPAGLEVEIGSVVRVPLGGRRVRGYVVGLEERSRAGLREILSRSGDLPVFSRRMLEVMRWAAIHYVAPLATLLGKAAPPNAPRRQTALEPDPIRDLPSSPLAGVSAAAAAGTHTGARFLLGAGPWDGALAGLVGPVLDAGRSALVVAPSVAEARHLFTSLEAVFGARVLLAASELSGAELTRAWAAASRPGSLLVGTREAVFWPVAGLSLGCVLDEGRRGMKDRATPTTHARDVLWRRSAVERFPIVLCGAVPTTAALQRAPEIVRWGGRLWGLVELVDRGREPPGGGLLGEAVRRGLSAVVRRGGRAFVFCDRRAPAMRCASCRVLRLCPNCGARPEASGRCGRCAAELGRCPACGGGRFEPLGASVGRLVAEVGGFLGRDVVGEAGTGRSVEVGTERDLPSVGTVDLAVVVDADGVLRAPHYRALEDGLRLLARVAGLSGGGSGRRAMVQTADPNQETLIALRRGDPLAFLQAEMGRRSAAGFPPSGELLVLEMVGGPEDCDASLRGALGGRADVHGPAKTAGRSRWLIQGRDLQAARLALRPLVGDWRDGGARVRVDADPSDL